MNEYFIRLKDLIEETYSLNGGRRIVLIGHSMGNNYLLYFLNNQSRDWKEKYIVTYISLSAPWIGSVKPLLLMTSGINNFLQLLLSTHVLNSTLININTIYLFIYF